MLKLLTLYPVLGIGQYPQHKYRNRYQDGKNGVGTSLMTILQTAVRLGCTVWKLPAITRLMIMLTFCRYNNDLFNFILSMLKLAQNLNYSCGWWKCYLYCRYLVISSGLNKIWPANGATWKVKESPRLVWFIMRTQTDQTDWQFIVKTQYRHTKYRHFMHNTTRTDTF